ncbi:hypothetical protein GRJ2_003318200 [Grus japonensis]|uniref:Uncharacterized protein n=1 Tax=Grus japonensis TaxID=30415 RepID=A0ABC9YEM9_GRUJA
MGPVALWESIEGGRPLYGSPTQRVAEAAEGEGESSQFAEVKAIQLALDIAEREKCLMLCLYTDSWMVANALWGWLQQWKQSNWQRRGKPIWAAPLWQDIAAQLEKLVVKVRHIDTHITLPQTPQGKRYVFTMVEATTGWLETYSVPHATARNTILGLEKQVLWRHGTPERIESDNGTHFRNNLIDTWAKEHGH